MKAYKGFNKDLQCTPCGKAYQYAIGETYKPDTWYTLKNGEFVEVEE